MLRRNFLCSIASLPFLGNLVKEKDYGYLAVTIYTEQKFVTVHYYSYNQKFYKPQFLGKYFEVIDITDNRITEIVEEFKRYLAKNNAFEKEQYYTWIYQEGDIAGIERIHKYQFNKKVLNKKTLL